MKVRDVFARWKKKKLSTRIISALLLILAVLIIPLLVFAAIGAIFTKGGFLASFRSGLLWGIWGAAEIGLFVYLLLDFRIRGAWRVKKVNFNLEDSHFMEPREIARNEGFTVTKLSELGNVEDGMLIIAERTKKDINVVLRKAIHAIIIAATGTGKTASYVSPFLEILSRTKTQPCMVVTDPKGELYARHAVTLKKRGYNVHVINMTDTYHSTLWNPFADIMRKTDQITEEIVQVRGRYEFLGRRYDTFAEAEQCKKEWAVRARDEIYVDLQDLIYTCCPVEAAQDKSWQEGARDLIFAMALRMWEDYRDGYLPKEKFNIYNLWWNLSQYARGECELLKEYINDFSDESSRAPGMGNTVLVSQDRTLSSYLGTLNQYLHWMADGGIAQLTSGNEIDFAGWDESPNVLFINVPEAKENRRQPVVLLLVQLYKALIEKANMNFETHKASDARLLRNCYFIMDEFGNLPRFNKLEQYITIARSKHIFFAPVIQDYSQLIRVYGETNAKTIRSNCNINIFMGTNEDKTREEISAACGKTKTKSVSYSEGKDMTVSTSAQSVPLIYPSELKNLNDPENGVIGNAVVTISGLYPIRGKTTPYFKAMDLYGIEELKDEDKRDFMIFNENKNRYDIARTVAFLKSMQSLADLPDGEAVVADIEKQTVISEVENFAAKQIILRIKKEIKSLEGRISVEDFARLSVASSMQKAAILDELAEKATAKGDMFLAAALDKIRSYLLHGADELAAYEAAVAGNAKG